MTLINPLFHSFFAFLLPFPTLFLSHPFPRLFSLSLSLSLPPHSLSLSSASSSIFSLISLFSCLFFLIFWPFHLFLPSSLLSSFLTAFIDYFSLHFSPLAFFPSSLSFLTSFVTPSSLSFSTHPLATPNTQLSPPFFYPSPPASPIQHRGILWSHILSPKCLKLLKVSRKNLQRADERELSVGCGIRLLVLVKGKWSRSR